jgi:hypothetical protein
MNSSNRKIQTIQKRDLLKNGKYEVVILRSPPLNPPVTPPLLSLGSITKKGRRLKKKKEPVVTQPPHAETKFRGNKGCS